MKLKLKIFRKIFEEIKKCFILVIIRQSRKTIMIQTNKLLEK